MVILRQINYIYIIAVLITMVKNLRNQGIGKDIMGNNEKWKDFFPEIIKEDEFFERSYKIYLSLNFIMFKILFHYIYCMP